MRWVKISLFAFLSSAAVYFFCIDSFSVRAVSGPLFAENTRQVGKDELQALSQPYRYLGKGRQAFVFASQDGRWVLKFFNQKYHQMPIYAAWIEKERLKREKRKQFYLESYQIAIDALKEETGLFYLHFGPSSEVLPSVSLTDRVGREHLVDLNQIPFVLQKKTNPFYPMLNDDFLESGIQQFVSLIGKRISKNIADSDHDVEHNFGIYEGKVIHIDPGRLHIDESLQEPERLRHEWWSATHRFRKWLEQEHPGSVAFFDECVQKQMLSLSQNHSCEGVEREARLTGP